MKICKARQICRDVHGRENPKRPWQNFWFAYENLLKSFSEKERIIIKKVLANM